MSTPRSLAATRASAPAFPEPPPPRRQPPRSPHRVERSGFEVKERGDPPVGRMRVASKRECGGRPERDGGPIDVVLEPWVPLHPFWVGCLEDRYFSIIYIINAVTADITPTIAKARPTAERRHSKTMRLNNSKSRPTSCVRTIQSSGSFFLVVPNAIAAATNARSARPERNATAGDCIRAFRSADVKMETPRKWAQNHGHSSRSPRAPTRLSHTTEWRFSFRFLEVRHKNGGCPA